MTEWVAACTAALMLLLATACGKAPPQSPNPNARVESTPAARSSPSPRPLAFRGDAALSHAARLVALGPRLPGTPASEQARIYCEDQLTAAGWVVVDQAFDAATPNGNASFVNVVARFPSQPGTLPDPHPPLLLGAHYDTSRTANGGGPGANDGASGPAVLIETATALAGNPALASQIELVLFDGREPVRQFSSHDGLYGSRFHAAGRATPPVRLNLAILLGMVGAHEGIYSLTADTPAAIAQRVQELASAQDNNRVAAAARPAWDDHLPFLHAGIPALLLTDSAYPYVRTADDTLDRLDAGALARTGSLVLKLLAEPPRSPAAPPP